jgi:hypothetical protein
MTGMPNIHSNPEDRVKKINDATPSIAYIVRKASGTRAEPVSALSERIATYGTSYLE